MECLTIIIGGNYGSKCCKNNGTHHFPLKQSTNMSILIHPATMIHKILKPNWSCV
jgi:hypothetical protein